MQKTAQQQSRPFQPDPEKRQGSQSPVECSVGAGWHHHDPWLRIRWRDWRHQPSKFRPQCDSLGVHLYQILLVSLGELQEIAQRQSGRFQLQKIIPTSRLLLQVPVDEHLPSQLLHRYPFGSVNETLLTVVYKMTDFVNKIAFVCKKAWSRVESNIAVWLCHGCRRLCFLHPGATDAPPPVHKRISFDVALPRVQAALLPASRCISKLA